VSRTWFSPQQLRVGHIVGLHGIVLPAGLKSADMYPYMVFKTRCSIMCVAYVRRTSIGPARCFRTFIQCWFVFLCEPS